MMQIKSLKVSMEQKIVLEDIDLQFESGITGILGPNGAGKSTLLRTIAGLINVNTGHFFYRGCRIQIRSGIWRSLIGYTPQSPVLYEQMTVEQFLSYMLHLSKPHNIKDTRERVKNSMCIFDLLNYKDRTINYLSGGVKQRIALAQAFIHQPEILLLDEPMNNLDFASRRLFQYLVLSGDSRRIILVAGHDLNEMEILCSKILILKNKNYIFYDTPLQLKEYARGRVQKVFLATGEICQDNSDHKNIIRRGVSGGRCWIKYALAAGQKAGNSEVSIEDAYQVILNDYSV